MRSPDGYIALLGRWKKQTKFSKIQKMLEWWAKTFHRDNKKLYIFLFDYWIIYFVILTSF